MNVRRLIPHSIAQEILTLIHPVSLFNIKCMGLGLRQRRAGTFS
jgi:hypothetical protein